MRLLLVVSVVLAGCVGEGEGGDDTGDPEDGDLWIIEREPAFGSGSSEPPNCPEFAPPDREIRLRGRHVEGTPVLAAYYELISQTPSVSVWSVGTVERDELGFTANETWPLAGGGTEVITMTYRGISAPASGTIRGYFLVGVDVPDGPPDYQCERPLTIVSVVRE